jgi:hypothetical protein
MIAEVELCPTISGQQRIAERAGEIGRERDRWSCRPKTAARACFLCKGVDDPPTLAPERALRL